MKEYHAGHGRIAGPHFSHNPGRAHDPGGRWGWRGARGLIRPGLTDGASDVESGEPPTPRWGAVSRYDASGCWGQTTVALEGAGGLTGRASPFILLSLPLLVLPVGRHAVAVAFVRAAVAVVGPGRRPALSHVPLLVCAAGGPGEPPTTHITP